jgi:hypothetical protein
MIAAVRPTGPSSAFLTGWDAALMPMLLIGCDGGTNATSGVVPEITRKLYDLTLAGQSWTKPASCSTAARLFDAMLLLGRVPRRVPRRPVAARHPLGQQPTRRGIVGPLSDSCPCFDSSLTEREATRYSPKPGKREAGSSSSAPGDQEQSV